MVCGEDTNGVMRDWEDEGRQDGQEEFFWGDIGIEYGIKLVVMIELKKIVRMERKEEEYRGMKEKNIFCKSNKKIFA